MRPKSSTDFLSSEGDSARTNFPSRSSISDSRERKSFRISRELSALFTGLAYWRRYANKWRRLGQAAIASRIIHGLEFERDIGIFGARSRRIALARCEWRSETKR